MNPFRLCLILGVFAIIGICCGWGYQAAGEMAGFEVGGYSDEQIKGNTAYVNFAGNVFDSPRKARVYLLYRSAKITIDHGYDFFVITSSSTSPININIKTEGDNVFVTDPPTLHRAYPSNNTLQGFSFTVSRAAKCYGNSRDVSAVIKMFQGEIPSNLPNAFMATDIMAHYGPDVQ